MKPFDLRTLATLTVLLAPLVLASCIIEIDFSPLGNDVSASGAWTIDGAVADATSCANAGIETVEVVFYDGGVEYRFPSTFSFPCSDGSFDTRPDLVLDRERFSTQWRAYNADGDEVARGESLLIDTGVLAFGGHAILASADFVTSGFNPLGTDASFNTNWTIDSQLPTPDNCTNVGIASVEVVLYDSSDFARGSGVTVMSAPCGDGSYASPTAVLKAGSYLVSTHALDADGLVLAAYDDPDTLTIDPAGATNYTLGSADFATNRALVANLMFDKTVGAGEDYGSCTDAGVTDFTYVLENASSAADYDVVSTPTPCIDFLTWNEIPLGTYDLTLNADGTGGAKWTGSCTALTVTFGTTTYNCLFNR